jgi:hypothetical protein
MLRSNIWQINYLSLRESVPPLTRHDIFAISQTSGEERGLGGEVNPEHLPMSPLNAPFSLPDKAI